MALAYALTVWSTMARVARSSGEQGMNRGSPWVLWKKGWRCSVELRPCSSGSSAVQCRPTIVMTTTASPSAPATSAACGAPILLSRSPSRPSTLGAVRLLGHQAAAEAEGGAKALGVSGVWAGFIAERHASHGGWHRAVEACASHQTVMRGCVGAAQGGRVMPRA